ncbi:MAG: RDD family protein [Phycisphaerae bacterium]|nr:RDD family protein [Phycisphaerae bacterium]
MAFCTKCGKPVQGVDPLCFGCQPPVGPQTIEAQPAVELTPACTNCGKELNANIKFCTGCGTPSKAETTPSKSQTVSAASPPPVKVDLNYANVGFRAIAFVIDIVIVAGIGIVLSVVAAVAGQGDGMPGQSNPMLILAQIASVTITLGYFITLDALSGQTIGKKVMGLQVVTTDGQPINFAISFGRTLLGILDFLPNLFIAGFITMLVSKKNQRLGDMAVGTVVIKK